MEDGTWAADTNVTHRPRLYNIVHTYIQKQLPRNIHPAFKALRDCEEATIASPEAATTGGMTLPSPTLQGQKSNIDQAYEKRDEDGDDLPLEELYKDATSEERLFKAALERYEKTTKDSKYKTNIVSEATHTWEEVLAEVNAASERYNEVHGFWGKIRKGLRSFGDKNQAFDAWAGLLPTQSQYLSILCGGLKLIFSAAARLKDLRKEVCEALAEIPVLLASTHRALGAFKKSIELHRCSADLYCATISTLCHIVEWYKVKAMKKFAKSLFKQSTYEQELSDLIQAVRTQSQRFDISAKLCSYETIRHTNDAVRSHHKASQDAHQEVVGQLDRLGMDQFQQNNLLGNIVVTESGNIQQMMGVLASRFGEMSESKVKELIEDTMKATLENFLSSSDRMDYRTKDVRGPMLPMRKAVSESQLLKERQLIHQQLLADLEYEDSVLSQDVSTQLQTIWTAPRQDQDRVVAIMRSHKLQNWITNTSSAALFVNANGKGFSPRQHPASFISAKLLDSLTAPQSQPKPHLTVPLAYFCSEHLPASSPTDMMRSLLAQLLNAYPCFSPRTLQRIQQSRSSTSSYRSLPTLCFLFTHLLTQLPPYMIVSCVIDSISHYEDNEMLSAEAIIAVRSLVDTMEQTKGGAEGGVRGGRGCVFKLLLTSAWNSRVLYKEMPDQEGDVIWMPAKVPAQGGFTVMKWDASVGSNLGVSDC